MKFLNVFIKKPYVSLAINLVFIISGLISFPKLNINSNPIVDFSQIFISQNYYGVNNKTIEESLLKPMEDAIKGMPGLKQMKGYAWSNEVFILLEFDLSVKSDYALNEVSKILSTLNLPKDVEPYRMNKVGSNSETAMVIDVNPLDLTDSELAIYLEQDLIPKFEKIKGVKSVTADGLKEQKIKIKINSATINALRIAPLEVKNQIIKQLKNTHTGQLENNINEYSLYAFSLPTSLRELETVPIVLESGQILKLKDIAQIELCHELKKNHTILNGKESIALYINTNPNANLIGISKKVSQILAQEHKISKNKLKFTVIWDSTRKISASYRALMLDLIFGAFLAIFIVFLFLRSWQHTLVCSLSIPISLIGSFFIIRVFSFSLNNFTLLALSISIGIIIDDAIVVIENIYRHKTLGKNSVQAAKDGTLEISKAAVFITTCIVIVLLPIAFMDGLIGKLFYEFAIVSASCVTLSLFVSFTLIPMLTSLNKNKFKKMSFNIVDNIVNRLILIYTFFLKKCVLWKKSVILTFIVTIALTIYIYKISSVQKFIDFEDKYIKLTFNLEKNISFTNSLLRGQEIEKYLRGISAIKQVELTINKNNPSTLNYFILLPEENERNFKTTALKERLNQNLKQFVRSAKEGVTFNEDSYPIQINLLGLEFKKLISYAEDLKQHLNSIDGVSNATIDLENQQNDIRVKPNLFKAALYGVKVEDIINSLNMFFKGDKLSNLYMADHSHDIYLYLNDENKNSIDELNNILIASSKKGYVPLASVAQIELIPSQLVIKHIDGKRSLTVKAFYNQNDFLGVNQKINQHIESSRPFGVYHDMGDSYSSLQSDLSEIYKTILFSLGFIFILLCAQFGNLSAPLSIVTSIPLGFLGTIILLYLSNNPITLYSFMGIIFLMGVVAKNAILLIEFAEQKILEGFKIYDALIEAAQVRFRPILMTTLSMIFGILPLLFDQSVGHEIRQNFALSVLGGLISSTLLSLFVVPCFYCFFAREKVSKFIFQTVQKKAEPFILNR